MWNNHTGKGWKIRKKWRFLFPLGIFISEDRFIFPLVDATGERTCQDQAKNVKSCNRETNNTNQSAGGVDERNHRSVAALDLQMRLDLVLTSTVLSEYTYNFVDRCGIFSITILNFATRVWNS